MLSKEQIEYFDKNPEMVSTADVRELIAMLRDSETKADKLIKSLAKVLVDAYPITQDQAIDAINKAMQRDCDYAQHAVQP